jgi:Icc protein
LHTVVPIGSYVTTSYTSAEETNRILEREGVVIAQAPHAAVPAEEHLTVSELLPALQTVAT